MTRTLLADWRSLTLGRRSVNRRHQLCRDTEVRITTIWNLEWFPNGSAREATPEKQAQRIQAAADVLKKL